MDADTIISIDQFAAVDLRAGKIISAEVPEGSDKLLLLRVDIGEDAPRVILSGIRAHYTPEDLVGRGCTVVANLAPRKMMGIESNGMLVCVSHGDGDEVVRIVEPPADTPVGSRLS